MAKKSAPGRSKPEDDRPERPELEGGGQEGHGFASDGAVITKIEAIRRAMAAGYEKPGEGTGFIRKAFGLDISKPHFSATKSQIKSQQAGKTKKLRPGRPPGSAAGTQLDGDRAPASRRSAPENSALLDAMEAIKPLVDSLGKDQVKRIVDLLG